MNVFLQHPSQYHGQISNIGQKHPILHYETYRRFCPGCARPSMPVLLPGCFGRREIHYYRAYILIVQSCVWVPRRISYQGQSSNEAKLLDICHHNVHVLISYRKLLTSNGPHIFVGLLKSSGDCSFHLLAVRTETHH